MRRRTNVVNNDEAPRLAQSDRRCKTGQGDELFDGSLPARGRFENAERHAATSGDCALFSQTIPSTPRTWTPPTPRRPYQRRRFSVMIDVTRNARQRFGNPWHPVGPVMTSAGEHAPPRHRHASRPMKPSCLIS
jgi:hypothetical protein